MIENVSRSGTQLAFLYRQAGGERNGSPIKKTAETVMSQIKKYGRENADFCRNPIFDLEQAVVNFEAKYIRNILELTDGDTESAARLLGISHEILQEKMERY